MTQQDLFDICARNHGGNTESITAHERTRTNKLRDRGRILDMLRKDGPMTCDEVEQHLGMSHQTASARMSEMKMSGHIKPCGKKPTRTGCTAQAWDAATPF